MAVSAPLLPGSRALANGLYRSRGAVNSELDKPTMGGMLDKPNTEKHTDRGEGKLGDGTPYAYGASAM